MLSSTLRLASSLRSFRSPLLHRPPIMPAASAASSTMRHSSTTDNNDDSKKSTNENNVLTKSDLIQILSKEYEMTTAQSARVLDTVLDTVVEVS